MVIGCRTKPIFELEEKIDGSNSYIKFGRNPIKTIRWRGPKKWEPQHDHVTFNVF